MANVDLLTATIGAAAGGAVGWTSAFVALRKLRPDIEHTEADTAKALSTTALDLLAPYRQQVAELRVELDRLHVRLAKQERQLEAMLTENRSLREHVAGLEIRLYGNPPE